MIAVITGYQAAIAGMKLADCPYSVVHQLTDVEKWIEGFLDCGIAYNLKPDAFERAFEQVVAAQIDSVPNEADLANEAIKSLGKPGSQARIEALRMFYEDQPQVTDDCGNQIYSEESVSAFA